MKINFIHHKIVGALAVGALLFTTSELQAQDCYASTGCSDYSNYGVNSSGAATLEYDNIVSAFHSTAAREEDGVIKIWGEMTQADGVGSYLLPTPINRGNYPLMTGKPLKIAMASASIYDVQFMLLTDDDKLWTWGKANTMVSSTLTTNVTKVVDGSSVPICEFQEFSLGLPPGVSAADVKMMVASRNTFLITTCSGEVWSVTNYWGNTGSGNTSDVDVWVKVKKNTGAGLEDLTDIVAARGSNGAYMALDASGNVWTWGYVSWDGVSARTHRSSAVQMVLPTSSSSIKMIGITAKNSYSSYYLLYEDGNLFALGDNTFRTLGDWTTVSSPTWVQPRYSSGGQVMDDIKWISPQEHDDIYRNITVINEDFQMYNWGQEDKNNLGKGEGNCSSSTALLDPGEPIGFEADYYNDNILTVETGGHTLMAVRQCNNTFGYVGHRINGSMADNSEAEECDNVFHFGTSALAVCGLDAVDVDFEPSVYGEYLVGNEIYFIATIPGGTYSIDSSSTATAILVDSTLTFTGSGTLRINYTVVSPQCGTVVVSKLFSINTAPFTITIPGNIWIDADGDAELDTEEEGVGNGLWANLVSPDNVVIASVMVNPDGTFSFEVSDADLGDIGDYSVVLTNSSYYKGDELLASDTLSNGFMHTGTNRGAGTGDTDNVSGTISLGDLSTITSATTLAPVNFGIQRPPVADLKSFSIDDDAFSEVPPVGYPTVPSFYALPMSSPDLTGYDAGGSLTGSDPEDCQLPSSCNTGTGTTFVINSINANTQLYYDFGAGPILIDVSSGPVSIPNFDVTKMVIYGEEGAGTDGDELGFTYSMEDAAGVVSDPVPYEINTSGPLFVDVITFDAKKKGLNVELNWTTLFEENNKGFEVERSEDAFRWIALSFVGTKAERGNSQEQLSYTFLDEKPLIGMNYYRLKQVDVDGKYTYSTVKQLQFSAEFAITVQPNPARDFVIISGLEGTETIHVYDANGRLVVHATTQSSDYTLSLSDLIEGVYTIAVENKKGKIVSKKVIKLN